MKKFLSSRRRLVRVLAIAGAVSIFAIGTATAAFKLRLSADNGATFPVVITDNGPGDLNLMSGIIVWSGSVGGFNVIVDTAQSKPVVGGVSNPVLDLNVTATTAGGAGGTLWMETTDTGYTGGGGGLVASAGGTQPGDATSSVQWDVYSDPTNAEFGTGGLHIGFGPSNTNPFAFTGNTNGALGSPFSLTNRVRITMNPNQQTITGDFNLSTVPEGNSLAMLLPGLAPLGLILRRRMKKV